MAVLSGEAGSEGNMREGISALLRPFSRFMGGREVGAALPQWTVWSVRKLLHLTEYAVLALLSFRWVSSLRPRSQAAPGLAALGLSAAYAVSDEARQAFLPVRTGSPIDVSIDLLGAALALSFLSAWRSEGKELAHRVLDLVGASFGLLLAAPLLVAAAAAVRLVMGPPVLFRQTRVGRRERPFTLLKLRTMTDPRGADGDLLPPAQRLTRLGKLLRGLSIDELPQLWNVLRGDMSLVGPRPLRIEYLPYYTERERRRHLVRPGLTGLAQVSGRNSLPWDQRLELDVRYVETKTLALDLHLILRTFESAVKGRDVLDDPIQGSLTSYRRGLAPQSPRR